MRKADDIKRYIKDTKIKTNPEVNKAVLHDLYDRMEPAGFAQQHIGRLIMKSKRTKFAAAAVIMIAALIGINLLNGTPAWADVADDLARVDYAHVYYLKSRDDVLKSHFEAWYVNGRMAMRGQEGQMSYDDGQTLQSFDSNDRRIAREPSRFIKGQTFFEVFTLGLLSHENGQIGQKMPSEVGSDFLIYELEPPTEEGDFVESIYVTVGRNSLLPVQMKIYHKDGDYDMMIFDYEEPEKMLEYFETPAIDVPNGKGIVLLNGEEVTIDIVDAPGLQTAVVRLHGSHAGQHDSPELALDITFITEEGFRSAANKNIKLGIDEAKNCGVGSELGGLDKWPDGKYRNIRFSPLLKPIDGKDRYRVEINCHILTKDD